MTTTEGRGWVATTRLLHYGVKGMRWGVRRSRTPVAVTVSQKGRKRLKAVGGQRHPASSDAVSAKTLGRVAKKSGYQALSDDQLRSYNNRLNLEANARRLDYQNRSVISKFISAVLSDSGKNNVSDAASDAAAKKVKSSLARTASAAA